MAFALTVRIVMIVWLLNRTVIVVSSLTWFRELSHFIILLAAQKLINLPLREFIIGLPIGWRHHFRQQIEQPTK
ncbi:MAG: hypothetical protein WB988_14980 [Candidatus Nitrosopolaris sp.]